MAIHSSKPNPNRETETVAWASCPCVTNQTVAWASCPCVQNQKPWLFKGYNSLPPDQNPLAHGQDAHATEFINAQPSPHILHIRKGAYLPHWTIEGACYFVTFRLADSLPNAVVQIWEDERKQIIQRAERQNRPLTASDIEELDHLFLKNIDRHLDTGSGSCILRQEEIARIVYDALMYFESKRHTLYAWTIMPNHVHVVVHPEAEESLDKILHSWKSFTSNAILDHLNQAGPLWQSESHDRLVRDGDELVRCVNYTYENPEKAGLGDWKWRWAMSLDEMLLRAEKEKVVFPGILSEKEVTIVTHGQDAHATDKERKVAKP